MHTADEKRKRKHYFIEALIQVYPVRYCNVKSLKLEMSPQNKRLKQEHGFSKNLLRLKFMQREEKCEKSETTNKRQIYPDYQFCERLVFGRLSFKGMNEEIEKLMYNK